MEEEWGNWVPEDLFYCVISIFVYVKIAVVEHQFVKTLWISYMNPSGYPLLVWFPIWVLNTEQTASKGTEFREIY